MGHVNDGPHDGLVAAAVFVFLSTTPLPGIVSGQAEDERAVHFQDVEREAAQVGEGGVAGPEIVHGQSDAQGAQGGQAARRRLIHSLAVHFPAVEVLDEGAFGQFQVQPARV